MAKPTCSEHKRVKEAFPGETAQSLGLKIGLLGRDTRRRLLRALGKNLKADGDKDIAGKRVILGVLLL
jgi:hypothetical protein